MRINVTLEEIEIKKAIVGYLLDKGMGTVKQKSIGNDSEPNISFSHTEMDRAKGCYIYIAKVEIENGKT